MVRLGWMHLAGRPIFLLLQKDLSVDQLSTSLTIEAFIIDILPLLIVTADVHRM
jgi:hypothetical protein